MAGRHGHDGLGEKRHSTRAHPRSESNALSLSKGFFNRPKVLVFSGRGHATFHVYMLQCADDSYYVGLTEDLESRNPASQRRHSLKVDRLSAAGRPRLLRAIRSSGRRRRARGTVEGLVPREEKGVDQREQRVAQAIESLP